MPIIGIVASSANPNAGKGIFYLSTTTVSGTSTNSVSLSGFSGYDDLMILCAPRTNSGTNADNQITFNSNTTADAYRAKLLFASGSTNGETATSSTIYRAPYMPYGDMTANTFGNGMLYIHDYANSTAKKTARWQSASPINTGSGFMIMAEAVAYWDNTAAITSVQITCAAFGVTYAPGSQFFVYGIKR